MSNLMNKMLSNIQGRTAISSVTRIKSLGKKIKNASKSALYFLNNRRRLPTDYLGRNKTNQTTEA